VGALSVDRKPTTVANALVTTDLHLATDVLLDIPPEVTFDLQFGADVVTEADDLFIGEIANSGVPIDIGGLADLLRSRAPDTEDVCERDLETLLSRNVDACDASHY
jgi:hypothetical protein